MPSHPKPSWNARWSAGTRSLGAVHQLPGRRHGASSTWPGASTRRCASSPSIPAACRRRPMTLIDQRARPLRHVDIEIFSPDARAGGEAWSSQHGLNLFRRSVPLRLHCCDVRKVEPIRRALRRTGRLDHRPAPRPVGDPVEHPQDRDRPRPRRPGQAQPAGRLDRGRGLGLRQRVNDVPAAPALREGLHQHRLRALHPRHRSRARTCGAGRWWWESERAQGVRHALRRSRRAASSINWKP